MYLGVSGLTLRLGSAFHITPPVCAAAVGLDTFFFWPEFQTMFWGGFRVIITLTSGIELQYHPARLVHDQTATRQTTNLFMECCCSLLNEELLGCLT